MFWTIYSKNVVTLGKVTSTVWSIGCNFSWSLFQIAFLTRTFYPQRKNSPIVDAQISSWNELHGIWRYYLWYRWVHQNVPWIYKEMRIKWDYHSRNINEDWYGSHLKIFSGVLVVMIIILLSAIFYCKVTIIAYIKVSI